jgi:hypothetical protein
MAERQCGHSPISLTYSRIQRARPTFLGHLEHISKELLGGCWSFCQSLYRLMASGGASYINMQSHVMVPVISVTFIFKHEVLDTNKT